MPKNTITNANKMKNFLIIYKQPSGLSRLHRVLGKLIIMHFFL